MSCAPSQMVVQAPPIPEAAPVLVRPSRPVTPPPVVPVPGVLQPPQVTAASALLIDAITGQILFEKNSKERRAVASTQKLLTALVVAQDGPLSDPVTVKLSDTQVVPSKLYLKPGETYPRSELVKALLVKSGNDIALALARDVAGSQEGFVARMNATAQQLGMRNSLFKNPHGLTETGQYSTAEDLAILARAVRRHAFLRESMKVKKYTFQYPGGATREIENTNDVLHDYPFCTGMKTGTTRASGKCLVSSAVKGSRQVIAVVLGSAEPTVWKETEALLKFGLAL